MTTILRVGFHYFALPASANTAAILKAFSGAVQVRHCYSSERPFEFRALHGSNREAEVQIVMVDSKRVGPPNPDIDDCGQAIEKPASRGRLLTNGGGS